MKHLTVSNSSQLLSLISHLEECDWVALDTEFISERRVQPELCLVQIATPDTLALIDAPAIRDLTPFWEALADGQAEILVHAFRGEMEFFYRSLHRLPNRVFDVQLAAGMAGYDYPTGFGSLVEQILDVELPKGEARTDWRKRPLSPRQVEYALNDVRYLGRIMERLKERLKKYGHVHWYEEEQRNACASLIESFASPWRRVAKCGKLPPRELAIVRELWFWRTEYAHRTGQSPNWVLRDDLMLEIAKRKSADPDRIAEIRGFPSRELNKGLYEIAEAVQRALDLPKESWPKIPARKRVPSYPAQTQLLMTALHWIASRARISPQLIGTASDVQELVAASYGSLPGDMTPRLTKGWRAEAVGNFLEDILNGRTAIRLRGDENDSIEFLAVASCE